MTRLPPLNRNPTTHGATPPGAAVKSKQEKTHEHHGARGSTKSSHGNHHPEATPPVPHIPPLNTADGAHGRKVLAVTHHAVSQALNSGNNSPPIPGVPAQVGQVLQGAQLLSSAEMILAIFKAMQDITGSQLQLDGQLMGDMDKFSQKISKSQLDATIEAAQKNLEAIHKADESNKKSGIFGKILDIVMLVVAVVCCFIPGMQAIGILALAAVIATTAIAGALKHNFWKGLEIGLMVGGAVDLVGLGFTALKLGVQGFLKFATEAGRADAAAAKAAKTAGAIDKATDTLVEDINTFNSASGAAKAAAKKAIAKDEKRLEKLVEALFQDLKHAKKLKGGQAALDGGSESGSWIPQLQALEQSLGKFTEELMGPLFKSLGFLKGLTPLQQTLLKTILFFVIPVSIAIETTIQQALLASSDITEAEAHQLEALAAYDGALLKIAQAIYDEASSDFKTQGDLCSSMFTLANNTITALFMTDSYIVGNI